MGCFGLLASLMLAHYFATCVGMMKVCKKNLTGEFTDIVVPAKGDCLLFDVSAKVITVNVKGNLTIQGISNVTEIVPLDDSVLYLKNKTTVDLITVTDFDSTSIKVEKTSLVKSLVLEKAGPVRAEGPFGSIDSDMSRKLDVVSAFVRKGINVRRGSGRVNICGSTVRGRTVILSRFGDITLGNFTRGCSGSKFESRIRVARGDGSVTLQSSNTKGVMVEDRKGDVSLSLSSLGKISVARISGDTTLVQSTMKRGATLVNIAGAITMQGAGFFGEVIITEQKRRKVGTTTIKESSFQESSGKVRLSVKRRGRLSISSTNFRNGTASVMFSGPIVFNGNGEVDVSFVRDRKLRIFENNMRSLGLKSCTGGAEIERNVVRKGKIESCTGEITIVQNVFKTLSCVGNTPAPSGKENAIGKSASGQCRKFR